MPVHELRVRDGAPVRPACAGAESACQGTQLSQGASQASEKGWGRPGNSQPGRVIRQSGSHMFSGCLSGRLAGEGVDPVIFQTFPISK